MDLDLYEQKMKQGHGPDIREGSIQCRCSPCSTAKGFSITGPRACCQDNLRKRIDCTLENSVDTNGHRFGIDCAYMIYVAGVVYVSHGPVSRNQYGLQPQIPVSLRLGDPIIRLNIKASHWEQLAWSISTAYSVFSETPDYKSIPSHRSKVPRFVLKGSWLPG